MIFQKLTSDADTLVNHINSKSIHIERLYYQTLSPNAWYLNFIQDVNKNRSGHLEIKVLTVPKSAKIGFV